MVFQTLKENPTLVGVIIILLIASGGVGYFVGMPSQPEQPTETPTQEQPKQQTLDDIEFNQTDLLNSHRKAVMERSLHETSLTVYRNNSTAYVQETAASDTRLFSFTRDERGETTELWVQSDPAKTLRYTYETENVTTVTNANYEQRRTQDDFLQYAFNAGDYKFTNVSITGPSTFRLTNLTDTEQLKLAIPAVSHRTNATITNTSINGTFENGHITRLEGTFDYTIESGPETNAAGNVTNNSTTKITTDYRFLLTVDNNADNISIQKPTWVTEYETATNETETDPVNETETNSTDG